MSILEDLQALSREYNAGDFGEEEYGLMAERALKALPGLLRVADAYIESETSRILLDANINSGGWIGTVSVEEANKMARAKLEEMLK
jgi:hypothetical protein